MAAFTSWFGVPLLGLALSLEAGAAPGGVKHPRSEPVPPAGPSSAIPARCASSISSGTTVGAGVGGGSAPYRIWETIPGVVQSDGSEMFRLEVTVEAAVNSVRLELYPLILALSGQRQLVLRDDGQGDDRVSGDQVFTSEPLHYDRSFPMPDFFRYDPDSPRGISYATVGQVRIEDLGGGTNQFLILPAVGLVDPALALTPSRALGSNLVATPYLLNLRTAERWTQKQLRLLDSGLHQVTRSIYAQLPDDFDFLVFFSADHLELSPATTGNNFNAGLHQSVRVNYCGTGQDLFDQGDLYGSERRLLGLNVLDVYDRGIYSQNLTHEISHQWGVYLHTTLGLNEADAHYKPRSSAASLLGGVEFLEDVPGLFRLNCLQGRAQAQHAPPLDKYLMGLIEGESVPPLQVYNSNLPGPYLICGQTVSNLEATITMAQIQRAHGVRSPGPATAPRNFTLGFVVESYQRFLSSSELIFYSLLADFYTRPVPITDRSPLHAFNWVSINSYFGEGTTWRSDLTSVSTPRFERVERLTNGECRLNGTGFPQVEYGLEISTNFRQWRQIASASADARGRFDMIAPASEAVGFYRFVVLSGW